MKSILSLYYDGKVVQAVKLRMNGASAEILDARTFDFDELESYLASCGEKRCIISSNPQHFFQDVLLLPPAAAKHYKSLVQAEIVKLHPDLSSFRMHYRTVGEALQENRPYNRIAVFSYETDFLSEFIAVLNLYSVKVSGVYASPHSISRLALSISPDEADKARVFVASLPGEKLLFVTGNNELQFVRLIPGEDTPLQSEDANNINMTVDYSFQSLRLRPQETVVLNRHDKSEDISPLISVPLTKATPPRLQQMPVEITDGYLAPVASGLHFFDDPKSGNIIPQEYAVFSLHRKLYLGATALLLSMTVLLGLLVTAELGSISNLESTAAVIRGELQGSAAVMAAFRKQESEAAALKRPLESINRQSSSQDPAEFLAALDLPESGEYQIKKISVKIDTGISMQIDGTVSGNSYSETQAAYEKTVALIGKIPGYIVKDSSIDINGKKFTVKITPPDVEKKGDKTDSTGKAR